MIVPLLDVGVSVVSDFGEDGEDGDEGGGSVNRYALSMRMIWLKLGLILESSTQHDCTINARSGGMSPGILGLSCCILRPQYPMVTYFGRKGTKWKEMHRNKQNVGRHLESSSICSLQIGHPFKWHSVGQQFP